MESSNQSNHSRENERSRSATDREHDADEPAEALASGRLVDAVVEYLRDRQDKTLGRAEKMSREDLARAVFRQLWRHPVPTTMLGVSVVWLLFAGTADEQKRSRAQTVRRKGLVTDEDGRLFEEGLDDPFADRLEEEVVGQVEGGYDYTRRRLQEVVNQYPWAAAAAVVGGGLIASALLPNRHEPIAKSHMGAEEEDDEEPLPKSPPPVSPEFPPEDTI